MLMKSLTILSYCWPSLLLTAAAAYLLGSISFAIVVTRYFSHTDIRSSGSGNAGATNVLRSQGKLPAILTTVGDLGKSICAVLVGRFIMRIMNSGYTGDGTHFVIVGAYLAGLFCIIGHLYPLYFGFRGGKGVMTTLGMMLILNWKAALVCLSVFAVIVLLSRMVSLGSICAALTLPLFTYLFRSSTDTSFDITFCTVMTACIALILTWKHIPNIRRILNGTESKISIGKKNK